MWQQVLTGQMPYEKDGIRLRQTDARDVAMHIQLYSSLDVRRFVGSPIHLSRGEALSAVTERSLGMRNIYAVDDIRSSTSIGECGFIGNNYIPQTDISIMLLPEFQSKGFGRRVLRILRNLWVYELKQQECFATVWKKNAAGRAILVEEGFDQVDSYTDVRVSESCYVYRYSRNET